MSVTAGVIDAVIAVGDKLRGKIGQTKVKRYWPGKAPARADDLDEVEDTRASKLAALEMDDRRMRRLAELRAENKAAARNDHKRKRQAEIISTIEEENDGQERSETEEEDEDAIAEKRLRVREKLLQKEQEEAALLPIEEEEEEEEEESEYDTESEAEQQLGIAMAMPVFLPKPQRDTIAERERIEEEERRLEESAKKRSEEIKGETKQIVAEEIRKDEEIQKDLGAEASIADIDTDYDMDEAEEYEAWKTREIAVIKRQREEREARLKEKEEIEKVRDLAEEERKNQKKKKKKKWRFMQKYHHKGAFFQSDPDDIAATEAGTDDIFQRDFSAPTGEDKMNKSILPKIMQVKQFGRSGRTKWTHLVNEDTTDWNALWSMNGPLRSKYNAKMAGMIAPIEKPKRSRTMKDCDMK